ncbi:MAG: PTS sugar transporter subunit IIA [Candidatus Cloacimonetes bacterium]|nr:PTS sugar transporter subunit IIA [Candidatus Cloacimonadota bacterium]
MNISEILRLECCEIDFYAKNKNDVLKKLAELLRRSREFRNIDQGKIYQALREREDMGSTGFSKGIAIPHCQLDGLDKFVIGIAISRKGINYDSMDKKKSKIFITIIGPKGDRKEHLKLLAQVSHVLKEPGVTDNLLNAPTKIGLYEEFLRNVDSDISMISKKGRDKLMILIAKEEKIMQDITEVFIEYGINESTIIETQQMENLLSNVPLFMGFFDFTSSTNPFSKIILAKISKDHINAIIKALEDIFGDLDSYSGLSIMVIDLFFTKGI